MKKIDRTLLYKILAGVGFLILCFTQLLHIRSMYNVESRNYNLEKKGSIQADYQKSIANDKLFPGGRRIIDSFLHYRMDTLEKLAATNREAFRTYAGTLCDSLFLALHQANNMDSLLSVIKEKNKISADLQYALVIQNIDLAFKPNQYVPFFMANGETSYSTVPHIKNVGVKIGGSLKEVSPDNEMVGVIVSSPDGRSYRIRFTLYCDSPDRLKNIILSMLPTVLVSIFSILAVLTIFLLTLINWQKQKKISEAKSDFINTITHEFQTPLSAIMIANKTIENENGFLRNEKLSFLTGAIKRQTERLNILTKQVAGTSTDHGIALSTGTCRVNELMDEIISDYGLNLQGKNTEIIFIERASADEVLLDKPHFTSIIINLLDNAVKYNHKPKKEIHIGTANPNEKVLALSIRDNGDGMNEKVRKNMFARFYRNPSLTRNNEPGLGLGLYFTKQSLDAHKWKYEVKSKEGMGTEFVIFIPIQLRK